MKKLISLSKKLPPEMFKVPMANYDPYHNSSGYRVDHMRGIRAIFFAENYCRLIKGKIRLIKLAFWEMWFLYTLFAWVSNDTPEILRYNTCFLYLARQNGKTTMSSIIALMRAYDFSEGGQEILVGAADKAQAGICFGLQKAMVKRDKYLAKHAHITQDRILIPQTDSYIRCLSGEAETKFGLSPSTLILDELHVLSRDFVHTLITGQAARPEALTLYCSTAGWNTDSICYDVYKHGCGVRDKTTPDKRFLPLLFESSKDKDWTKIENLKDANPSLGVAVQESYLLQEIEKAKVNLSYRQSFLRLHGNRWVSSESGFIAPEAWEKCGEDFDLSEMEGMPAYIGIDLSSTLDVTSFTICIPPEDRETGKYYLINRNFCPAEQIELRSKKDRVPYQQFVDDGWLEKTDGQVVDYSLVVKRILEDCNRFNVKAIGIDRWQSTAVVVALESELSGSTEIMTMGCGYRTLSPGTKLMQSLILSGRLVHNNNALLTWSVGNVQIVQDSANNIKPCKKKSSEKIDPILSGILAIELSAGHAQEKPGAYSLHGLRYI